MVVFLINGTASAMPATMLPFFVRDTLQAASWEPIFLGSYFVAAAVGLPLWVALVKRIGLGRSWLCGMGLSILAFCAVPLLGPGDAWAFEVICVVTGLALGADLAIPSALLTGVIHQAGLGQHSEGRFFGWWTGATKLNLALASGLVLPLLGWAGYQTGSNSEHNQMVLSLTYGLLPCVFKVLAAAALWLSLRRHPVLKGQS
jgi:Na+/melibiose symporter-like transporter